ncbi:TonB-dependent receptor plug domain-containing protein [Steroidobacter flavus]|uniref:TonB-dependent receptor plug domain-containing protein n=1 Tax=Steroidobacter flavus TaxID=1842136 RepID=A0ABV8SWR1_9GAMM
MNISTSVRALLGRGALVMLGASAAQAQDAQSPSGGAQVEQLEEIIVTGTFIRNAAPTGTNVVPLTRDEVIATGATNANEVLATIPQVSSNFNQVRAVQTSQFGINNLAPNLRNLGAAGGATTLVLMDGHRITNAGVLSTSPDPDVIPPGVLERVEIVPDGGSSLYGSDAVGGVINFITRKSVEGFEIAGHYGTGDNYYTTDLNLTAGTSWDSGSGYLSYVYAENDDIFGRDRDFVRQTAPNTGHCGAGTVFVGTTAYPMPGLVAGPLADCDSTDDATMVPSQTRHSVFGGLTQQLGDAITLDVRAFYTKRESEGQSDPENAGSGGAGQTVVICSPAVGAVNCRNFGGVVFPGYTPVAGDVGVQRVAFNYGGLVDTRQLNDLEEFQITPTLTADIGGDWQLRVLGSYGESTTDIWQQQINATPQLLAIATGALNPYNVQATNPAALNGVFQNFVGHGVQELINARAIVDGSLFDLPGGSVRLAAGAEYIKESLSDVVFGYFTPGTEGSAVPVDADRNVKSGFAELVIPIVGDPNAFTGVKSLTLSASARYDDYSDFGDTTNPKFGLTYQPLDWITLRGNKGKSFNAPSLADTNAPDTRSFTLPAVASLNPNVPLTDPAQQLVVLVGGNSELGPQEADTWSLGIDIDAPFLEGLSFSATYYNIQLTNQIALPPLTQQIYSPAYAQYAIMNPTLDQVQARLGSVPYLGPPLASLYTATYGPYALLDFRRQNLGEVKQDGIDFNVKYNFDIGSGRYYVGVAGTHTLSRDVASIRGAQFIDVLDSPGGSDLAYVVSIGGQVGNFTASAAWNHSDGYGLTPALVTPRFGSQTSVDSFDTLDLFFKYDLWGEGLTKDLSFTLNVENALDEDPPFYGAGDGGLSGYTNGSTLGRLFLLGVRKQF